MQHISASGSNMLIHIVQQHCDNMFQLYIKDLAFLGSVCSAGHSSVMVRRVRDMVAEGQDPESAQQMIVEERVCWDPDRRGLSRL